MLGRRSCKLTSKAGSVLVEACATVKVKVVVSPPVRVAGEAVLVSVSAGCRTVTAEALAEIELPVQFQVPEFVRFVPAELPAILVTTAVKTSWMVSVAELSVSEFTTVPKVIVAVLPLFETTADDKAPAKPPPAVVATDEEAVRLSRDWTIMPVGKVSTKVTPVDVASGTLTVTWYCTCSPTTTSLLKVLVAEVDKIDLLIVGVFVVTFTLAVWSCVVKSGPPWSPA